MTTPAVQLTPDQEERLHFVDREVEEAMRELERWLRTDPRDRPVRLSMSDDERARVEAALRQFERGEAAG
jgi:hypothetical protein